MENTKNVVWAVFLSLVVLIGWQLVDNYRINDDALNFERPKPVMAQPTTGEVGSNSSAVTPNDIGAPMIGQETSKSLDSQNPVQDRKGLIDQGIADKKRILIKNDRIQGSINLKGARFDDITLINYRETIDITSPAVDFLQPAGTSKPFFAEFGWVVDPSLKGKVTIPNPDTIWQASSNELIVGQPLTLSWISPEGIEFKQTLKLDENFMMDVTQLIEDHGKLGNSFAEGKLSTYGRIMRNGIPKELSQLYILHEGPIGFLNDGLEEITYDNLNDEPGKIKSFESQGGWIGITDKYWLAAIIPDQKIQTKARMLSQSIGNVANDDLNQHLYQTDLTMPLSAKAQSNLLFIGAKQTTLLDQYEQQYGIKSFDLAIDFGIFYFLTKPIFYGLHWLNEKIGNFGIAILILTVVIKAFLFPLANKSYISMSKMKLLQPKMLELRQKYEHDKSRLNQAMMQLYKDEKVNPLSGCLPILIQIPIFFSLYKVLYVTIEMRHAPFFGWIHDLSAPDPLGFMTLFGLVPWDVPSFLMVVNIGIWPILMGVSMWLQMRLNPTPADPIQQKLFTFMPIIFTFMLASFAAGLVIYWTWNNILSMTQQTIIMRRMKLVSDKNLVKPVIQKD